MIDTQVSGGSTAVDDGDRFVLEIVPVGENIRTARLFGASIARHFRCDEEQVEDLKLALSEAVGRALRNLPAASMAATIRVTAVKAGSGLTFAIEGPAIEDSEAPAAEPEVEPSEEELIMALFPDASFEGSGGSTEFTVLLP
ncbi:MAG: ATP-binding protein [Actinomycetota bacterium]